MVRGCGRYAEKLKGLGSGVHLEIEAWGCGGWAEGLKGVKNKGVYHVKRGNYCVGVVGGLKSLKGLK